MKYENGTWEIVDTFTNEVLAYTNGTSHIPIGMNQWHFPQSKCSDEGKDYRTLSFHKYVEQPGHYCCNDGTCFNSELVCDGAQNCESGEDEQDCQMIDIPSAYNKLLPPSDILVDFDVVRILGINDHYSTFGVYFTTQISWFDNKLKFYYLNDLSDVNIIPKDEKTNIWIPNIHFDFIRESFNDYEEKIFINKKSHPKMSEDLEAINVSEIYDGNSNPLIRFSKHDITFFCDFNGIVANYPFGTETCSFDFHLEGRAHRLTTINHTLKFPTEKLIGQYEIIGWDVKYSQSQSKNIVTVSVSLAKRKCNIFMMNYIPALLINTINQATNYITGDTKYDLIITVNITSMVVLATIYMSVSMSLPSTPDIKPVEVWLFFSIAYPFWVIITNVVMQVGLKMPKRII